MSSPARPRVSALAGGSPRRAGGRGRPGLVTAALAAAESWLLEPAEPTLEPVPSAPARPRAVITVFGLARGCGATVVARALAAELATRDPSCASAVCCESRSTAIPLATPAAARLARSLADVPGAATRAVGRLCLVDGADQLVLAGSSRHLAPLVLDAGSSSLGGVPASVADRALLVATPGLEPALAAVATACLVRLGPEPLVVLNRATSDERWSRRTAIRLPDSRIGAQLALGGREARGELGRAIAGLADIVEDGR
jgi:hypothetical protein